MSAIRSALLINSLLIFGLAATHEAVSAQGIELPVPVEDETEYASVLFATVGVPVSEDIDLSVLAMSVPELDVTVTQIDAAWTSNTFLVIGGGYWRVDADSDYAENVFRGYATFKIAAGEWSVDWRNIVEHRVIENDFVDNTRYRARFQVARNLQDLDVPISMYVWVEPFYDLNQGRWDRVRYALGVRPKLSNRLSLEIGYLRQDDRDARDIDAFTAGVVLRLP